MHEGLMQINEYEWEDKRGRIYAHLTDAYLEWKKPSNKIIRRHIQMRGGKLPSNVVEGQDMKKEPYDITNDLTLRGYFQLYTFSHSDKVWHTHPSKKAGGVIIGPTQLSPNAFRTRASIARRRAQQCKDAIEAGCSKDEWDKLIQSFKHESEPTLFKGKNVAWAAKGDGKSKPQAKRKPGAAK